jgi:hypothetical protein
MLRDLLLIEQTTLDIFALSNQQEMAKDDFTTQLQQSLSSLGKSIDLKIINQALGILPFIKFIDENKITLVQQGLHRGSAMDGASCIFNFTCNNVPAVHEESMY